MNVRRFNSFYLFCFFTCWAFNTSAQEVRNVTSRIEGKKIIVSYNLLGENPNARCEVKIYFGNSNAQRELLVNADGDLGADIQAGNNKQVTISDLAPLRSYSGDLTFRIDATYTYNPETGTISVTTDPDNARIYLNDAFAGNSDIELTWQNTGTYNLKIIKEGFLNVEKEIDVVKGQTTIINETLTPGYAAVIESIPENAGLSVNGIDRGQTHAQVVLRPGANSVKISARYYNDFTTTITPEEQNEKHEFTLTRKEYPLTIFTWPRKSSVKIDEIDYTGIENIKVTGPRRELIVSRERYKTYKGTIDIQDVANIQRFNILLEPETYRKKGVAMIYSLLLPGTGQSYLKRKGVTPLMGVIGYGLIAGSYLKYNQAVENYDLYLASSDTEGRAALKQQWQDEKSQSGYMLYGAAAIWAGNLVWTLLTKDEAEQYRKIKSEIKFDNLTNTGGISLLYQLGN